MKQYLMEFVGTFFLVLIIALSGNPVAIGFGLMILVYAGASISGAHYNPAVTFALFMLKKISQQDAIRYVISQIIGATVASIVVLTIFEKSFSVQLQTNSSWTQGFIAEALFTTLLVFVILMVAVHRKNQGNQYFGIAIGGTVLAAASAVGNISGGAFNPAVGIGPLIANTFTGMSLFNPSLFFLYALGPLCGAIIAVKLFEYILE